ncbi:MAG: signal peptidase II [Betaproteobacteria bacterium TMED156]|nr:MAG: signal peptidase II [Betaproteobacteria bacterium TMED156]
MKISEKIHQILIRKLFFFSLFIIFFDQLTKFLVLHNLDVFEQIKVTSFLNIVLVFNTGAAFSIFSDGYHWQRYMLITVSLIVILFLVHLLIKTPKENRLNEFAIYLIIAGAIGNLIDRIRIGMVTDFIDFHIGNYHWPAFNIADSAISIGAITLIFFEIKNYLSTKKLQE